MNKKIIMILICLILFSATNIFGQDKLAQTGYQFLSVSTDARGSALAGAMTTKAMGSSSLFFNPSGMATMSGFVDFKASQNNWIADIKHQSFSIAINPANNRYGVIGVSAASIDYGIIEGTMVSYNDDGFVDTGPIEPSALVVGVGYAKKLSDKFSVGGQVKYATQQLGKSVVDIEDSLAVKKYVSHAYAFDFGTQFKTGFKSFVFGMSIRNFSDEVKYEDVGFQLPLTFTMGISMNLFDFISEDIESQSLFLNIDAVHPRSYSEYINVGLEYAFNESFYLRTGYMTNRDERAITFGVGINTFGLSVDYSYTPFGIFDNVQRFTIGLSI